MPFATITPPLTKMFTELSQLYNISPNLRKNLLFLICAREKYRETVLRIKRRNHPLRIIPSFYCFFICFFILLPYIHGSSHRGADN